jgi:phenylacetic acid degradation operon negative regulatory protein
VTTASAQQVALAFLGASRGRALSAPTLVAGADILGVSGNATRLALSRLRAKGEIQLVSRGKYALSAMRQNAIAHVRTFKSGFAARVPWKGGFLGALTADLPRGNSAMVARRERALDLSGFREFRHGLWVRPDNLAGGRVVVATHLRRLGLDEGADTVELELDAGQVAALEPKWNVAEDQARASALADRVHRFLARGTKLSRRVAAAESFWLGDEVLRFLARDPLLPESMADPEPRARLAEAMATLDEQGFALWKSILEELEEA